MSNDKPLGERQKACLDALKRHGQYPGGWCWVNHSTTVAILESLVKRGLVTYEDVPRRAAADIGPLRVYRLAKEA